MLPWMLFTSRDRVGAAAPLCAGSQTGSAGLSSLRSTREMLGQLGAVFASVRPQEPGERAASTSSLVLAPQ